MKPPSANYGTNSSIAEPVRSVYSRKTASSWVPRTPVSERPRLQPSRPFLHRRYLCLPTPTSKVDLQGANSIQGKTALAMYRALSRGRSLCYSGLKNGRNRLCGRTYLNCARCDWGSALWSMYRACAWPARAVSSGMAGTRLTSACR